MNNMDTVNDIVVTGVGLVSPYGNTIHDFFEGLKQKKNVQKNIERFSDVLKFKNSQAIEVPLPDEYISHEDRILYMGGQAIRSCINDWGGNLKEINRVALIVGSGLGLADGLSDKASEATYLSSLGSRLAERAGINCEVIYIGNACCAGSQAISYSIDLLRSGRFDLLIAGGIDVLSPSAYAGFLRLNAIDFEGCRPFDKERKGIMNGEGAAFFIMQGYESVKDKSMKIYSSLLGSGVTSDAFHVVQIKPDGVQIKRAMDLALQESRVMKEDVDLIVCHGTGTIQNDALEAQIILDYFSDSLQKKYIAAPKSAIGHTGGASGAFGFLTALCSFIYKAIPPLHNTKNIEFDPRLQIVCGECMEHDVKIAMVNAFAFGGTNVVIVCKEWNKREYV